MGFKSVPSGKIITAGMLALMTLITTRGNPSGNDEKALQRLFFTIRRKTFYNLISYQGPSNTEKKVLRQAILDLSDANPDSPLNAISDRLGTVDLGLSPFRVGDETLLLLHEKERIRGRGLYMFRKMRLNHRAVLMVPHSYFDRNTGVIGYSAFLNTDADTLMMNSAHRYTGNRKARKDIFGTDVANSSRNHYYHIFKALADCCGRGVFIQLHGYERNFHFGKKASDRDIIISGGQTRGARLRAARSAARHFRDVFPEYRISAFDRSHEGHLGGRMNVHRRYLRIYRDVVFLHVEMNSSFRERIVADAGFAARFHEALNRIFRDDPVQLGKAPEKKKNPKKPKKPKKKESPGPG